MSTIVKLVNADGDRDLYVNVDKITYFLSNPGGKTDIHFGAGHTRVAGLSAEQVAAKIEELALTP